MCLQMRVAKYSKITAYPDDEWRGGQEAQWAGPPAGQRGPEAGEELAAEGLAWLQRSLGVDSGAGPYDLCLLYKEHYFRFTYTSHSLLSIQ